MNQATKQRLVGATVLVVAILWLVPVFLDGPADTAATISETVELPGVESQPNQLRTIELNTQDAAQPVADIEAPPPVDKADAKKSHSVDKTVVDATPVPLAKKNSEPATDPAPKPVERAPSSVSRDDATETKPAIPAVSDSDLWAVQLGSFSTRDNAEKLAAELRRQGFAAFISQHSAAGSVMHRVRIGPLKGRSAADAEAQKLVGIGQSGQVVAHP